MIGTTFLLAQLVLAPPCAAAVGGEGVRAILDRAALEPEPSVAEVATRLARLGSDAIPELFTVLALGPGEDRALTELEQEALIQALASFRTPALRAYFGERLASGLVIDERRALLSVLARVGSSADIPLARSAAQAGSESAALAPALEEAIARFLRQDPLGMESVRGWILQAPPELGAALVRGASRSECPTVLSALVSLLGFDAALDRVLVPEIGRLVERAPKPIAEGVVSALSELLAEDDPVLLREAALALGKTEDFGATSQVIDLLDHPERGVRAGAASALERLTGLGFRERSARWRAWYRAEVAWLREHGAELRSRLRSTSTEVVVSALGEISPHRFRRNELAAEIAVVLGHPDPLARRLACLTLARLGTSAGLHGLVNALEDPDAEVQEAARAALRTLGIDPGVAGPAS